MKQIMLLILNMNKSLQVSVAYKIWYFHLQI